MVEERAAAPARWRSGRWVLLLTAVSQAASPALAGFDQGSGDDPVIVPPGPFFAVWGLVVLGCLVVAVRGLGAARASHRGFARLHVPLSLCQVGFSVWLLLAAAAPALTVAVFAAMVAALAVALRRGPGLPDGAVRRGDLVLTEVVLGVYVGWSAAAVWINAASVTSLGGTPALATLLAGAVVTASVVVSWCCRSLASVAAAGATSLWALTGVAVSTSRAGSTSLAVVALAGCVVLAGVVLTRTRRASAGVAGSSRDQVGRL